MKEKLFKTAKIRRDRGVIAGFQPGQIVSVRYFESVYNAMIGKREPVYSVSSTEEHSINSPLLYASALENFVL